MHRELRSGVFSFRLFLIRQVLEVLLNLRAVLLRVLFVPRLGDGIPIALRKGLILPIGFGIFIWKSRGETAALDAVALAGAAAGRVRPLTLPLPLSLRLPLALLSLTLTRLAWLS